MNTKTIASVVLLGLVPTVLYSVYGSAMAILSSLCVLIVFVSLMLMFSGIPR